MTRTLSAFIILFIALSSCNSRRTVQDKVDLPPAKLVINFSGDTLLAKTFPDSIYQVLLVKMLDAKALAEQYPDSANLAIWYGRRVAYMGRYHEAIEVFSGALKKFPDDHRLLRHRGHRYLTTRQIDLAIADYERANVLAKKAANAIEPDGIPNKLDQPLSNDKFNIYYHQGLAYYLNGEFEKAITVYRQCMEVSDNDDLKVATSYWLYMTLHRLGMEEEASKLLDTVTADMSIVENDAYLDLLMLFKGEITDHHLLEKAGSVDALGNPTLMYGLGYWYLHFKDWENAKNIWAGILKNGGFDSFGFIAAEKEISDSKRYYTVSADLSHFFNTIFEIGDKGFIADCNLNLECDCCGGQLSIDETTFDYYDVCFPLTHEFSGFVEIKNDSLILNFTRKAKIIYDSLGNEQSKEEQSLEKFNWKFAISRCNGKLKILNRVTEGLEIPR